jgi:hypothetical protein
MTAHQEQLKVWANNCPENYENRVALVDAEIAAWKAGNLTLSVFTSRRSALRATMPSCRMRRSPMNSPRASTRAWL